MYRELWKLIIKEYGAAPILVATSLLALAISFLEAFNVGLLLPLLESLSADDGSGQHWISKAFNRIFDSVGLPFELGTILLVLGVVVVIMLSLKYIRMVLLAKTSEQFTAWMRAKYMWTFLNADLSYFHSAKLGTLTDSLTTQIGNAGLMIIVVSELLTLFGMVLAYSLIALFIAPVLTGLAFGIMLMVTLAMQYFIGKGRAFGFASAVQSNRLQASSVESLSGIHVIRSFSQERNRWQEYDDEAVGVSEINFRRERNVGRMMIFQEASLFALISALVYVGVSVLSVDLTVIFALLFTLYRLAPRVSAINASRHSMAVQIAALEHVKSLMEGASNPKIISGTRPYERLEDGIRLDNVNFSYNGSGEVLKDTNFLIEKGKTTAIIGSSGAGKSTLVDLILRHYDPDRGGVLVDGVDLRELDLTAWRKSIGVVSQDVFLFNDTVAHNISMGRPEITQEDIVEAAKKSYAHDFILELPEGYGTQIGDRGWNLSGGQRQRISLARAIISNPEILILDEATSSLDSESERLIKNYMTQVQGKCTMVVIAHRMDSIRNADKIVVLQDGNIVEEGDWDTLVKANGLFASYRQLQSGI